MRRRCAGLGLLGIGGDNNPVATSGLGGKKRSISEGHHLVKFASQVRGRNPETHREVRELGNHQAVCDPPSDPLENLDGLIDRTFGQNDDELLPAIAARQIGRAQ